MPEAYHEPALASSTKALQAGQAAGAERTRPTVRAAEFSDYEGVAALQTRNGLPTRSREDWIALWRDNPVYQSAGGKWTIGWKLEAASREIVGFIASIPVAYRFRGREIRAAVTSSWVIDPPYRGYSFAVLNAAAKQKQVDLMLTNTASYKSDTCLRLLRWSRVPVAGWDKSYFWVTNYTGFARSLLTTYSIPMAGLMGYALGAGLYCTEKVRNPGCDRFAGQSLEVELCAEIDARFDTFWDKLASLKPNTLLGVRDRQTLVWHFKRSIEMHRAWILRVTHGSEMIAYAVLDRADVRKIGMSRARLVDFQAICDPREPFAAMLAWMLRKCRADRVHVVETSGAVLANLGDPAAIAPYRRTLNAWRYYYKALNPDLADALKESSAWCTSHYDGDASL